MDLIWGAVLLGCGIFVAVYGSLLFRFVLAVMGFGIGFYGSMALLSDQDTAIRILIGLIAGGIAAGALYALITFGLYIAGGLLGIVAGFVVASLFGQTEDGVGWAAGILMAAGAGGCGFFGKRLGNWIIILATSAVGGFLIVGGLSAWFDTELGVINDDVATSLNTNLTFVLFLVFTGLSGLAQMNISNLRRRLLN
jgi:hypothetical protein